MTDGLLLDTHIVLWLANGDPKLRTATRVLIEGRWRAGDAMLIGDELSTRLVRGEIKDK